jgi:hypothetical protein
MQSHLIVESKAGVFRTAPIRDAKAWHDPERLEMLFILVDVGVENLSQGQGE